jgi:hypothetical protein
MPGLFGPLSKIGEGVMAVFHAIGHAFNKVVRSGRDRES